MNADQSSMARTITLITRIVLGVVFMYASFDKIADPTTFAKVVTNYRLLPPSLVSPAAILLPWIEAVCGLSLVFGRMEKGASLVISMMLVAFIAITLYNGYRGLNIACGCFSLSAKEPSNIALNILRNGTLLAAGTWILFYTGRRKPVPVR